MDRDGRGVRVYAFAYVYHKGKGSGQYVQDILWWVILKLKVTVFDFIDLVIKYKIYISDFSYWLKFDQFLKRVLGIHDIFLNVYFF